MCDLYSMTKNVDAIRRLFAALSALCRIWRVALQTPARSPDRTPVSCRRLPETGIFQIFAGDYRPFLPGTGQIRSLETDHQFAKARHWRAFLGFMWVESLSAGLAGWRRSADRTRLHPDSLVSGNFTGNFAISRAFGRSFEQETAALQPLLEQFPTQINREIFPKNRELLGDNRELSPPNSRR